MLDTSEIMLVKKEIKKQVEKDENENKPNHIKCSICEHWVPELSFNRHEAFCSRNSWKCSGN